MSLPSLYPLFLTSSGLGTGSSIEVGAVDLTVVQVAESLDVGQQIKLLILPEDDEVLQVEKQGVDLQTTSGTTLMET